LTATTLATRCESDDNEGNTFLAVCLVLAIAMDEEL
jgi:hypothetical protein